MSEERWQVRVMPRAKRQLEELPERYATAVAEMLPRLASNPRRMGKPLRLELEGQWAARRGPYRVIYEVAEKERVIRVLAVAHRADVYRRP